MEYSQIIDKIEEIIDDVQTGILTTIDSRGAASIKEMMPVILKYPTTAIYCFSLPHCEKPKHLAKNNKVVWMIQRADFQEIVKIRGTAAVIYNPAIKAEMIDRLGPGIEKLRKTDTNVEEFLVIETTIETAEYYKPTAGLVETVIFSQQQQPAV
jgi:general stress protein 26